MLRGSVKNFPAEAHRFFSFFFFYIKKKTLGFSRGFEQSKNLLVKFFMIKRGRYSRPFLHITTMVVLGIGMLVAPLLADTYPVFSSQASSVLSAEVSPVPQSVNVDQDVFQTQVSAKPRDAIITYTVEKGDTVSAIARKFSTPDNPISTDTIRWANDIQDDNIAVGDQLKILPVSGVAHKVESGDSVYSIADKYKVNAQNIVEYPFNDFANPETFSLIIGEIIIVPGGVPPEDQSNYKNAEPAPFIAQSSGSMPVLSGGWSWPVGDSIITQYASWYHMALDIAGPIGTPVYAAHSGTVERVSVGTWDDGYGTNVWVNDGDGIETHYAHLNSVNVSVGQQVTGGQSVVGFRGNTGRSTGPHTHFEIRVNGTLVNPLVYVHP